MSAVYVKLEFEARFNVSSTDPQLAAFKGSNNLTTLYSLIRRVIMALWSQLIFTARKRS